MYQKSWSYAILFLRYMVCDGCNCYFSFWAIFCPFTTLIAQKIKISKKKTITTIKTQNKKTTNKQTNKKDTWRYHFTHVYQKLWLDDVRFLRYGARQTDGRKKLHTEVGAPPKKNQYFEQSATLLGMKKTPKNCKLISLIQTLIYR